MIDSLHRHGSSSRESLDDFAACDAGFLLCAFLRGALLFVHADSGAWVYRPQLQQALALRLLPICSSLAHRFTWLRANDLRSRLRGAQDSEDSGNVRHLAQRARSGSRAESTALARAIRKTDSGFELKNSAFDPVRYARNLEQVLQDGGELSPIEMDIVFKCWAGVFCQIMRDAYVRYASFLENRHHMMLRSQQHPDDADSASTMLSATGARRGGAIPLPAIPPRFQKNPLRNKCS